MIALKVALLTAGIDLSETDLLLEVYPHVQKVAHFLFDHLSTHPVLGRLLSDPFPNDGCGEGIDSEGGKYCGLHGMHLDRVPESPSRISLDPAESPRASNETRCCLGTRSVELVEGPRANRGVLSQRQEHLESRDSRLWREVMVFSRDGQAVHDHAKICLFRDQTGTGHVMVAKVLALDTHCGSHLATRSHDHVLEKCSDRLGHSTLADPAEHHPVGSEDRFFD